MKTKLLVAWMVAWTSLWLTGCISTVDGKHKGGMPFVNDTREARYNRPVEQVFAAAKDVLAFDGTLYVENVAGMSLEAKVDNCTVWIKCKAEDKDYTHVYVQVRTSMGGGNQTLAADIDKQIAVRLASGKLSSSSVIK